MSTNDYIEHLLAMMEIHLKPHEWHGQNVISCNRIGDLPTVQDTFVSLEMAIRKEMARAEAAEDENARLSEQVAALRLSTFICAIERRLDALEATGPAVADSAWMAEIERRLDTLGQLQGRYDRLMESAASAHSLVNLKERVNAIENALAGDGDENIGQFGRLAAIEQRIDRLVQEAASKFTQHTRRLDAIDDTILRRIDAVLDGDA